jgi:hypothetical protein
LQEKKGSRGGEDFGFWIADFGFGVSYFGLGNLDFGFV